MAGPSNQLLDWALGALSADGSGELAEVRALREGGAPWLVETTNGSGVLRVLNAADPAERQRYATEQAALALAVRHGVPAPRILATDPTGEHSGAAAMLLSVVPGTSRIPGNRTPQRLPALGAAAAALHRIPLAPTRELPLRTRSIADVDFAAMRREAAPSALLVEAERLVAERLAAHGGAADGLVFVHGDLWQGNIMSQDDIVTGIIDWDCAGAGHPGIDLGSLRCDAVLFYGLDAADEVLAGWRAAMTTTDFRMSATEVAHWDLVAGLCTPPDLGMWLSVLQDQGRTDLDRETINARRDEFLTVAIKAATS